MAVATTKAEVLQRLKSRLIEVLPDVCNEQTVILSVSANPLEKWPATNHRVVFVVSPTGGRFGTDQQGGGDQQPAYSGGAAISIFVQNRQDRRGHDDQFLTDTEGPYAGSGILQLEGAVLYALVGHYLTNADGDCILTDQITPMSDSAPQRASVQKIGDLQILVALEYHWDLTMDGVFT